MSRATRARRTGLVLGGIVSGLLLALLVLWGIVQRARTAAVRSAVRSELGLPDEVFRLERLGPGGLLAITLRDVAVLDRSGDTIAAAPIVRLALDPTSLDEEGPIVIREAEIRDPLLRLVQEPDGEWNWAEATALEAGGEQVRLASGEEPGRGVVLRDVRVRDGRGVVITPAEPPRPDAAPVPGLVRTASGWVQRREVHDLDALLSTVRVGGPRGWRAEVASLDARLENPDVRVTELRGFAEQVGEDGIRFAIDALRTPNSFFEGRGVASFAGESPQIDAMIVARPLDLRDLQGLGLAAVPESGTAEFVLDVDSRPDGRTAWSLRDARLAVLDSEVTGHAMVLTGGEESPAFADTRLLLEPLRLSTLERAGLVDSLPLDGEVRGTITSTEAEAGAPPGTLRIDLAAELRPEDAPQAEPSVVVAQGLVGLGAEGERVDLQQVRLELEPLQLSTLAAYAPEREELLRGIVRGGVTLSGTPADLRVDNGAFAYEVGDAPATRIRDLSARVSTDPALRYTLSARAEPLALATLTELFPALPFEQATLSGPISVRGSDEGFRFETDLQGAAGGVALGGSVALGEPLRFDVSGELDAFRAGAVLASGTGVEGPLSGSFAAAGTPADFRFDVDLAQDSGSFALGGRVRRGAGSDAPFAVAVDGRVENFRVGNLIGRPGLLASPVSGEIQLSGDGQTAPYRFRTDLRGEAGVVDVRGFYAPGAVPSYAASGVVSGVNPRALPGLDFLPATPLDITLDVAGRGTTPETLAGRFNLVARPAAGLGDEATEVIARLLADNGVLRVDTFAVALPGVRLAATGALGLVRPAEAPLRFTLAAADLARLAPLIPPPGPLQPSIAGSLAAQGIVTGTVRRPEVAAALRGSDLRYEEWRADGLAVQGRAARAPGTGWRASATLAADGATVPGAGALESVRLQGTLFPGSATFAAEIRQDADARLALAGGVRLDSGEVRAVEVDSLTLELRESTWRLDEPARIAFTPADGLTVNAFALREVGAERGVIAVEGRLPFRGDADLRVRADGVGLEQVRRLADGLPEVAGTASLDLVLRGPVGDPELRAAIRVDSLRYEGVVTDRVTVGFQYAARRLDVDAAAVLQGRQVLSAEAVLPVSLSLAEAAPDFELRRAEPMRAHLTANALPLDAAAAVAPGLAQGAGYVNAEVLVTGTPADPEVGGQAAVSDGAVFVEALGVRFEEIQARIALADQRIQIDTLTLRSEGTASLSGTIGIDDPERPIVYLQSSFQNFRAIDRSDVADLAVSGRLALSGRFPDATLAGRVVLEEGEIAIPDFIEEQEIEIVDADVGELGADTVSVALGGFAASPFGALRVEELEVAISDQVWVENRDARVQIAGSVDVYSSGGAALPRVFGVLRTVRGTYDLRIEQIVREFEIEQGTIEFYGTPDVNPALDIVAVNEVRAVGTGSEVIRIAVLITGTLESPEIQLTSDTRPPLPESELLSYLVFGRPSGQLAGLAGSALPTQLLFQEVLGATVASELERAAVEIGLDYLRFRGGPGAVGGAGATDVFGLRSALGSTFGSATIEAGKQLVPNVFLTVEAGIQQLLDAPRVTFGAALEWQIDDQWSVRTGYQPVRQTLLSRIFRPDIDYQFFLDLRRRWEFGRSEQPELPGPTDVDRLPGEVTPPPEGDGTR